MIQRLRLRNFRSVGRDVQLTLGSLNVLVGPNGSGKSNLLRALTFMRDAVRLGLPAAVDAMDGIGGVLRQGGDAPGDLRIEVTLQLAAGPATYGFAIGPTAGRSHAVTEEWASVGEAEAAVCFRVQDGVFHGPANLRPALDGPHLALTSFGGDLRFRPLVDALGGWRLYDIDPSTLRTPERATREGRIDVRGHHWLSTLAGLRDPSWKSELVAVLGRLTGDIDDVRLEGVADYWTAAFHHRGLANAGGGWLGAALESDGTLRVAGILTALLQQPAPTLLALEEPEHSVHPAAMPALYDYVREASTRSQVVVTTHSPQWLDLVDLDETRVLTVGWSAHGTAVEPLGEERTRAVKDGILSLGDLMLAGDMELHEGGGDPA